MSSLEVFPSAGNRDLRNIFWGCAFALFAFLAYEPADVVAQPDSSEGKSEAAEPETPAEDEKAEPKQEPATEPENAAEGEMKPEAEEPAAEGEEKADDQKPAESLVPDPVEPASEQPEDETSAPQLPEGYKPPGVRPKEMAVYKELMTKDEETALGKELRAARAPNILRDGQLDPNSTELLKKIAKYYVYRLSIKEYVRDRELHKRRDELMTQVRTAASIAPAGPQRDAFRTAFLQEVVDRTTELLDGNAYVRLNAAFVLSGLDLREYDSQRNPPAAVPFSPAFKPLLQILKTDEQGASIEVATMTKIAALRGIYRIATTGTLSQTDRLDAAEQMVADLKNPKYIWWYHLRLIEALSRLDLSVDRQSRPFIVQLLTEIVADRGRTWLVRSYAAKGLGRTKIPANLNLNKVLYEIVQLCREMVEARNKQLEAQQPEAPYWKRCFYNVYIAFHPLDPEDRAEVPGIDHTKFGFLQLAGQYKPVIQSAYEQVVPLARQLLNGNSGSPFPEERTKDLDSWLKQNIPGNQSVAPNMPPINSSQARDVSNFTR